MLYVQLRMINYHPANTVTHTKVNFKINTQIYESYTIE